MKKQIVETVGLIAAVVLPFFNIPLILKIIRRKSSRDISLAWALGIWICLILMAPSGLSSADTTWRTFNAINLVLFTLVLITIFKYRKS